MALVCLAVVPEVSAIQCYQCSTQTAPDCADPFTVLPPSCPHADPRLASTAAQGGHASQDDLSAAQQFLADCPADGKDYFCVKTRQEEMGSVLVTRGCAWEEEDRQDSCMREEWADKDYLTVSCSCQTAACNRAPRSGDTAALSAAILLAAMTAVG